MIISNNRAIRTGKVPVRPYQSVPFQSVTADVAQKISPPTLVRWSFYLFVFTVPFESADLSITSGSFSISKLSGLFFLLCYFFYHNPFVSNARSLPAPSKATCWFVVYLAVFVANGFFIDENLIGSFASRLVTLMQLVVFFWIAAHLLEEEKFAKKVLAIFAGATALLAIGMLLDLPGFSETLSLRTGDRDTALGMNPNSLANLAAVAGVLLIGLLLSAAFKGAWVQAFFASLILPLLVVSVKTGSRAGIGIFVIGCAIYLLPYWPSRHRVSVFIFALCGIAGMLYLVIQDPTAFTRWQMTFKEGDLTGRDKIFSEAVSMISEKPLFGWQPVEFQIELGTRTGVIWGNRDAHNLFFHFLLEVGMVGAIPFFIGLWLCGRAAWRARKGSLGLLPLAVFLSIMAGSLSHTGVANKHLWLVLAVTTASESALFYTRRAQMRGRAAIKTMKRHA